MSTLPDESAWDAPRVTPEREAAWTRWKDNYLAGVIDGWIEQGATDRDELVAAAAAIIAEFDTIEDLPWMPLEKALMSRFQGAIATGTVLEGDERVNFLRSLRTAETSTREERVEATALLMGITVQQAGALAGKIDGPGRDDDTDVPTALYRHYDQAGRLLYVGIAKEPLKRTEQHRYHSKWYRFVARTKTEWFDTRAEAAAAEREAIASESPIFNDTHNKANRSAAVAYLFDALTKEEVA